MSILHLINKRIILFIFLIVINYNLFGQVKISGQISGFGELKTCEVYLPIGIFCNENISKTIPIRSDGTFNIEADIKSVSFIKIRIATEPVCLFVEPGDNISFRIQNTKEKNNFLQMKGNNAAGNYWYNIYNYIPAANFPKQEFLSEEIKIKSAEQVLADIKLFLNKETAPMDSLQRTGKVTTSFAGIAKKDVYALHMRQLERTLDYMTDQAAPALNDKIKKLEKLIYETYSPADPDYLKNRFGNGYMGSGSGYLKMLAMADLPGKKANPDEVFGVYNEYLRLPLISQDYLLGTALILEKTMAVETFPFEKGYNTFKTKFPESPYIPVIEKLLKKEVTNVGDTSVHFDTVANFNTIKELVAKYKGHSVLIDLWATWCIPCKMEFSYYKSIYDDLKTYDVTPLFVSIDDPMLKNLWKKTALQYDLKGYHVIATKALLTEIKNIVFKKEALSIPRYILINSEGEIIDANAPRPSDKSLLINELKSRL